MTKLVKKIKMKYAIEVLTGLHIGGNSDNVEIGGVDNPVIKLSDGKPYIPGSSLKGKIRCLLEQEAGANKVGEDSAINELFGVADKSNPKPSKIIVRDFYFTEKSIKNLEKSDYLPMPYTENKSENSINRVTGKADNPRQTERVPAGVTFEGEIILNVWDNDNEQEFKNMLNKGINLLENDYLGGSGSRGYGQVKLTVVNTSELSESNEWTDKKEK
ncbi:MAG: type III-A CRISPR-associated RAMP protein Csm3 [Bacteroidales bacterium]|nr:type III-A CRISPR-associated RAMP protein Csm3 [Bacteroidales bacterium]